MSHLSKHLGRNVVVAGLGLGVLVLAACSKTPTGNPIALTFQLSVNRSIVVEREEATFEYSASGPQLDKVIIDYGDGRSDTVSVSGKITAVGQVPHSFRTTGMYTVNGRVLDSSAGTASASVTVEVTGPTLRRQAGR